MRRADRAVTDRERILQVIESCECCRVGFSCPEGAYIVPLNFAFVPGSPDRFYFHGAHEGRKAELIRTARASALSWTARTRSQPDRPAARIPIAIRA